MNPIPCDPDALLRYDGFVRSVARAVIADAAAAEDLVQQALLNALQHAPGPTGSVHGWLATIVRNLASKMRRDDSRRREREARAARAEAVPSAAEILEREASRRAVVDAVLALEEPYRSAVLLRYFEELPPRAIAKRLAVPVATVHTRIKRALARLRSTLTGGGRDARGLLALLPLARLDLLPALTATGKAKVAAVLVAALGLGGYVALRPHAAVWDELVEVRAVAAEAGARAEPAAASRPDAPAAEREPLAAESRTDAAFGSLLARVVWAEDGTMAAGIAAEVTEWSGSTPATVRGRRSARSDAFGLITLGRVHAGPVLVMVDRGCGDNATVEPERETRLTIEIPRGYDVEGSVVDRDGRPVGDAEVRASRDGYCGTPQAVVRANPDGAFAFRCLPTGSSLCARAAGHAPSLAYPVEGAPGTKVSMRLALRGPGGSIAGTVLDAAGRPAASAGLVLAHDRPSGDSPFATGLALTRPVRAWPVHAGADGSYALEGLEPGLHHVVAASEAAGTARGSALIEAGKVTRLDLRLGQGVTVLGTVRTSGGALLPDLMVTAATTPAVHDNATRTAADGTFRLAAIPPGDVLLRVDSRSFGRFERKLLGREGSVVRWDVVFDPPRMISGRVLDDAGNALACWHLRLYSEGMQPETERDGGMANTDASGRFAFPCRFGHGHRIEIFAPGKAPYVATKILNGVRPSGAELEVRIDRAQFPSARIRGRVVDAAGRGLPGARLLVATSDGLGFYLNPQQEDGSFDCGPFRPDSWSVVVHAQGFGDVRCGPETLAPEQVWDLGTLRLGDDGTVSIGVTRDPGTETARPTFTVYRGEKAVAASLAGELTERDGRLVSGPLAAGDYALRVEGGLTARDRVPFTVEAGKEARIEARVRLGYSARVVVREETPDPACKTARYVVRADDGSVVVDQTLWRQDDGRLTPFVFQAPGFYDVTVTTPGGKEARGRVRVDAGSSRARPLELVLR